MDDNSLIKRCQNGDTVAFEQLLNHYYDTIYRFAYRWCGDQHNAQDITQQACLKLTKALKQFKGQSSFTSWLYRLVINCAKDFYKSPTQHNQREESDHALERPAQDKSARQFYSNQVLEHIDNLQEDFKDALILVYGTGLSHHDAAQRLGIKESTVSWRIYEARKLLKQTFNTSGLEQDHNVTGATL